MAAATGVDPPIQPATIPHEPLSTSYWLANARQSDLIGHRSSSSLPASADCVVIGAGMSGSLVAYFLLLARPELAGKVVCLEAREVVSGATGRNGGHCRPDCYGGYAKYKAMYGKEQAMKVLKNEMDTLNLVQELVEAEHIDCDLWRGRSFDALITPEAKTSYRRAYDEFVQDGGDVQQIEWIDNEADAKLATRLKSVKAAASFPGGSFYPYKFATHLLRRALSLGLNLQTYTPATAVVQAEDGYWVVETPRGRIRTRQVVHATNAYASVLIPELHGKIVPTWGQCSSITPTRPFAGKNMLTHSLCLYRYSGDFDYLIQRPVDGTIIFGVSDIPVRREHLGDCDDSGISPSLTSYLANVMKDNFEGWGEEAHGEGLERTWRGIMGYTSDSLPFVGPFPGKDGQFVCAGFHGHGMARIATCARGLAKLLQGEEWRNIDLPECFQVTPERLELEYHFVRQK